jgi:hypothetical protein
VLTSGRQPCCKVPRSLTHHYDMPPEKISCETDLLNGITCVTWSLDVIIESNGILLSWAPAGWWLVDHTRWVWRSVLLQGESDHPSYLTVEVRGSPGCYTWRPHLLLPFPSSEMDRISLSHTFCNWLLSQAPANDSQETVYTSEDSRLSTLSASSDIWRLVVNACWACRWMLPLSASVRSSL